MVPEDLLPDFSVLLFERPAEIIVPESGNDCFKVSAIRIDLGSAVGSVGESGFGETGSGSAMVSEALMILCVISVLAATGSA